jgi:hypothetical protein
MSPARNPSRSLIAVKQKRGIRVLVAASDGSYRMDREPRSGRGIETELYLNSPHRSGTDESIRMNDTFDEGPWGGVKSL